MSPSKTNKLSIIVLGILFLVLLSIPIITQGPLFFAGGDDTKLYYIYPQEFIKNFATSIISDNALAGANTGYNPASHFVPMLISISFIKKLVPFNVQFFMYGLNWAFGMLFFYLFLSFWITSDSWTKVVIKISSSLFFIFSPFLTSTLYKHQLLTIYLISLFPACLYFFGKSVLQKNPFYTITAVLIFSIFSTNINTLPWTIPLIITSMPLLLIFFLESKKYFLINSIIATLTYTLLNIHWIFHLLNSHFVTTGLSNIYSYYSSPEISENIKKGILGVSGLFSPLNQVTNQLDLNLTKKTLVLPILNTFFLGIILSGGILLPKIKRLKLRLILLTSFWGLVLSWFLISPNFGDWGPKIFLRFADMFWFFNMFRNMFDKFALPLAFYYAFSSALSLYAIRTYTKKGKFSKLLIVTYVSLIFINMTPLLSKRVTHEGVTAKISGEFNEDFNSLVSYINNMNNTSRFLWLPMNFPTYVNVEDKYNKNHFYSGLSPINILTNKTDYAGGFSFMTPTDAYLGDELFELIEQKKYIQVGKMLQQLNARFIILDKQALPEQMHPYLYGGEGKPILKMQGSEFRETLLGKKIKDFGNRYSLYEINSDFLSDRIYLTNSWDKFPLDFSNVDYKKISSNEYEIKLNDLVQKNKLVILDPFYKDWILSIKNQDGQLTYKKGENIIVHKWANGWEIDPVFIKNNYPPNYYKINEKGGLNATFTLFFQPTKYNKKLWIISGITYAITIATQIVILSRSILSTKKLINPSKKSIQNNFRTEKRAVR